MIDHSKRKLKPVFTWLVFIIISSLLLTTGCKDAALSDDEANLEQCKVHLDAGEWSEAISKCEEAGGDEGYHLAAQAYMGRGGFSLYDMILAIANSPTAILNTMFNFIPDSATKKSDFKTALTYLMGSSITTKTDMIHIESILVSSVIILGELKEVFNLDISGDVMTYCNFDATSGAADACGFTLDVTVDTLLFSGFGSSFYTNLCGNADSTFDNVYSSPPPNNWDVTIDSCTVQAGSIMSYHKTAHDGYVASGSFVDGTGDVFDILNFYTVFDSGLRGTVPSTSIDLCDITPFTATDISGDDGKIFDCEIFGSLTDPSSPLFN